MHVLKGHKDAISAVAHIEERNLTVTAQLPFIHISLTQDPQISCSWDGEVRGWLAVGAEPGTIVSSIWVLQAHQGGIEVSLLRV